MRVSSATRPVLERDVEVGADEDALARDVRLANGARPVHRSGEQLADHVDQPARVAPLVVVPAEHLDGRCRAPS